MKIGEDIGRIPAGEFLLITGLLFEINRWILHPFGLALEVIEQEDEMGQIHIVISEGLLDLRTDPEGLVFGERAFIEGKNALSKFLDDYGRQKLQLRKEKLGYIIQHHEFNYIDFDSMDNINKAKLDAARGAAKTIVSMARADTATGVAQTYDVPVTAEGNADAADEELQIPGTANMSVQERNAILRAKNKINTRKGKLSEIHNTPAGEPCENPVLTKETLPSGGFLIVCDTCGATLQDSDMVQQ
jgi:hypothetical protein